jgi:hypothetical protein
MAEYKKYDVMVRVAYSYENEYGDTRSSWTVWIGECKSRDKKSIAEWVASEVIEFDPGEKIKRVIHSEISNYTITEVNDD